MATCADLEGVDRGSGHPLKNRKNIGFLSNFGPDPLINRKDTKPAFNVGPSSARKRNAIEMAFRWRANDGRLRVVFGSFHQLQKNVKVGPPQNFLDPRMGQYLQL